SKIKTTSSSRAAEVDVAHPIPISLHDLVKITRPQIPSGDDNRVDAETKVYTIDAHLVKFQSESGRDGDGDYHLVISDDTLQFMAGGTHSLVSRHSFVAEIPKPECVPGRNGDPSTHSVFQTQLSAVRRKFEQQFPNITGGWNEADGIAVRIT